MWIWVGLHLITCVLGVNGYDCGSKYQPNESDTYNCQTCLSATNGGKCAFNAVVPTRLACIAKPSGPRQKDLIYKYDHCAFNCSVDYLQHNTFWDDCTRCSDSTDGACGLSQLQRKCINRVGNRDAVPLYKCEECSDAAVYSQDSSETCEKCIKHGCYFKLLGTDENTCHSWIYGDPEDYAYDIVRCNETCKYQRKDLDVWEDNAFPRNATHSARDSNRSFPEQILPDDNSNPQVSKSSYKQGYRANSTTYFSTIKL